ncbi:hypothetical protein ACHAXT_006319 [Thalassiosira profunda]
MTDRSLSTEQTPLVSNRTANKPPSKRAGVGLHHRSRSNSIKESGDVLAVTRGTHQRKNVGKFRRKRQDYATWKGRIGVHVVYDELDLKKLMNVIYQTLSTEWESVDCYDVVRLWLPVDSHQFSGGEEGHDNVPAGGGEYAEGDGQIHASMPEVFVFGFGAVVFWNFRGEETEKQWIEQHLSPHKEVLGLRHNPDAIESACDEMGFAYGEQFKWHRDVVQLLTRDAGEKLAVSFAVAKSSNLSIYEWRMSSAIQRNAHIPEDLAKHGQLHLNRREINVEIGRLYLLNNAINLETNMLDTPEEFWEDDRFQMEYDESIKYLDITKRVNILNSRLAVLKDLNSILMDAAHNHHATILEWIIIILIVAEIAIESFRAWRETYLYEEG